jgi:WhiB family redox-sensing transcriptional regulator
VSAVSAVSAVGAVPPPTAVGEFRLSPELARAAAEAAGTRASVVARAVEVAVAGGPDVVDGDWFSRAGCVGVPRSVFFPTKRSPRAQLAEIRDRTCRRCPVRGECLASALVSGETSGYWGNVGPTALRRLRRVLRTCYRSAA